MLRRLVRRGILEDHDARSMLEWPHSGFHVHDSVLVPEDDTSFTLRLARYCARNPVALDRLEYDAQAKHVLYRSDKSDGPMAGTETVDRLEFLARLVAHIPDKRQVMTRYYGWYASRPRGTRRKRAREAATGVAATEAAPIPRDVIDRILEHRHRNRAQQRQQREQARGPPRASPARSARSAAVAQPGAAPGIA